MTSERGTKRIFSAFLYACICVCCTSKDNNNVNLYGKPHNETSKLVLSQVLKFQIDSTTSVVPYSHFIINSQGKEYIICLNRSKSRIEYFDVENRKKAFEIQLNLQGPNSVNCLYGFLAKGLDSGYVFCPYTYSMSIVNRKGEVVKKYQWAAKTAINNPSSSGISTTFINSTAPAFVRNDTIYCMAIPDANPFEPSFYKKQGIFQWLSLKNGNVGFGYTFPEIYQEKNFVHLFARVSWCTNDQGQAVCSFGGDNNIQVFNFGDQKHFQTHKARSLHFDSPDALPKSISNTSDDERLKYETNSNCYGSILYDRYRQVYYRIALHKNENTFLGQYYSQPFSIIILNDRYEKIGETIFPARKYNYIHCLVGEKGLYISESNPDNTALKEDELRYAVFSLEKHIQ